MRIPVYLVITQWALLFGLGLLVIVMYRQLGRYFGLTKPDTELGPPVGQAAADLEYLPRGDDAPRRFTPGGGRAALVAFVDPTCPACEDLVTALGKASAAGELAGTRVLLLTSDPPSYLQISEVFRTTRLEVGWVQSRATLEAYRVSATPLLVAIDKAGVVRSAGPVTRLADVRAFGRACLQPFPAGAALPVVPAQAESRDRHEAATIAAGEDGTRQP